MQEMDNIASFSLAMLMHKFIYQSEENKTLPTPKICWATRNSTQIVEVLHQNCIGKLTHCSENHDYGFISSEYMEGDLFLHVSDCVDSIPRLPASLPRVVWFDVACVLHKDEVRCRAIHCRLDECQIGDAVECLYDDGIWYKGIIVDV